MRKLLTNLPRFRKGGDEEEGGNTHTTGVCTYHQQKATKNNVRGVLRVQPYQHEANFLLSNTL